MVTESLSNISSKDATGFLVGRFDTLKESSKPSTIEKSHSPSHKGVMQHTAYVNN